MRARKAKALTMTAWLHSWDRAAGRLAYLGRQSCASVRAASLRITRMRASLPPASVLLRRSLSAARRPACRCSSYSFFLKHEIPGKHDGLAGGKDVEIGQSRIRSLDGLEHMGRYNAVTTAREALEKVTLHDSHHDIDLFRRDGHVRLTDPGDIAHGRRYCQRDRVRHRSGCGFADGRRVFRL